NFLNGILHTQPQNSGDLSYYPRIERIGDLADIHTIKEGAPINQPEIRITPSRTPLDFLVLRSLDDLSSALNHINKPTEDDIVKMDIQTLLQEYKSDESGQEVLKNVLEQAGFTGKLVQASKRLNTSLSNVNRHIFSREGLLFYTAFRAIEGLKVEDVDGIITNMMASLEKIKAFINVDLVNRVIEEQHLDVSETELVAVQTKVAQQALPYAPGLVVPAILREVENIKRGGDLFDLVYAFLDSKEVQLPYGTDKSAVAAKMVNYLVEIGFQPQPADEVSLSVKLAIDSAKTDVEGQIKVLREVMEKQQTGMKEQLVKMQTQYEALVKEVNELKKQNLVGDPLERIKGMDTFSKLKLFDEGIKTFKALSKLKDEELGKVLPTIPYGYTYADLILQAKLIVSGHTKKLKSTQEFLPREVANDG
ncbi:MAG: hypothetical protein AAF985_05725, partial [Bacteroidota bacterium]